jgi:hypothetical protein
MSIVVERIIVHSNKKIATERVAVGTIGPRSQSVPPAGTIVQERLSIEAGVAAGTIAHWKDQIIPHHGMILRSRRHLLPERN